MLSEETIKLGRLVMLHSIVTKRPNLSNRLAPQGEEPNITLPTYLVVGRCLSVMRSGCYIPTCQEAR